ncbi:MAG TPA: hypothetical protein VFC19_46250 [Candidatus Limnocylindrales bacterium]|nr:hypothetical protein [Candidatus Limnocylindrales bacterium]
MTGRRARISAEVIHRLAALDEPVYVAMLGWAQDLERAAREVESLPAPFWKR